MGHGPLDMDHGQWTMGHGPWAMGHASWTMGLRPGALVPEAGGRPGMGDPRGGPPGGNMSCYYDYVII